MFERRISEDEVRRVVIGGETIESYPNDRPYPSRLILGWNGSRPLHVVAAENAPAQETIIVTVYQPEGTEWQAGFKRRKRQ